MTEPMLTTEQVKGFHHRFVTGVTVVTTYDGGNPSMGGAVLASANSALHGQALDLLNQG